MDAQKLLVGLQTGRGPSKILKIAIKILPVIPILRYKYLCIYSGLCPATRNSALKLLSRKDEMTRKDETFPTRMFV